MLGVTSIAAPESPFGLPLWLGLAVMFAIVVARAQATYWLGRAAGAGFAASRWAERIGRERLEWAERFVARFGPGAVTLSFLTVGVQTAVNAIAGASRMPFGRYLAAMLAGSVLWTVVWTVGGLGAVWAAVAMASRWPTLSVAVAVTSAITMAAVVARRRRRAARRA